MFDFTTTKLVLIQQITEEIHNCYNLEFKSCHKNNLKEDEQKVRIISIGSIFYNLEFREVEIAAALSLTELQVKYSIEDFNILLKDLIENKIVNKLWKYIITSNSSIKYNLQIIN